MTWTLHLGDCLEYLKMLPDGSVDAFVVDPPYGMDLQPQRQVTKAIAGDVRRDAKALLWGFSREAHRLARDNTHHIVFGRWSETWMADVLSEWFTVKGCIVWRKNMFGIGYYLRPQWELAWYLHKGNPPVPEVAQSDVWECAKVQDPEHSCEKPEELMKRAVGLVSREGDMVFDPFAGSGTTGVAAIRMGRNFIGCEISPEYHAIATRRLKEAEAADGLFAQSTTSPQTPPAK